MICFGCSLAKDRHESYAGIRIGPVDTEEQLAQALRPFFVSSKQYAYLGEINIAGLTAETTRDLSDMADAVSNRLSWVVRQAASTLGTPQAKTASPQH